MSGKRFEAPRPDWNILRRLGELAQMRTHESDGRSVTNNPDFLPDARSDSSPLQTFFGPADYCIGQAPDRPAAPAARNVDPVSAAVTAADSGEEGRGSDEVRQSQAFEVMP